MNPIETLKRPDLLREQCFVGGRWVKGDKTVDVEDKATGERIAGVPFFGTEETKEAIDKARQALSGWRAKSNPGFAAGACLLAAAGRSRGKQGWGA